MDRIQALGERLVARWRSLSPSAKAAVAGWVLLQWALLFALYWYTPKRIFEGESPAEHLQGPADDASPHKYPGLANWANGLRESSGGWLLIVALIACASFPPMIGYTTAVTIAGFAYGLKAGFALALTGTLLGAMSAFTLARLIFSKYAHRIVEQQKTLKALGGAIKTHGLGLIVMIRLCPFPYSYSNFFFASIKEVSPLQFFLANCAYGAKVLLHVYIGTRLYLFSDPEERGKMDKTTKIINTVSVVVSLLLGIGVGTFVYRLTMGYVAEGELALADDDEIERFIAEESALEDEEEAVGTPLHNVGNGSPELLPDHQTNDGVGWEGRFSDFDETEGVPKISVDVSR